MIIQCPYCATRYQLDAARLSVANPKLKCSRCQRMFPAPDAKKSDSSPAPKNKRASVARRESLKLPFDEAPWKDEDDGGDDLRLPEADDRFVLGTGDPPSAGTESPDGAEPPRAAPPPHSHRVQTDDEPSADAEEASDAELETEAETYEEESGDFAVDDDERDPQVERRPRPQADDEASKVRAMFFVLALVLTAYGGLARALIGSPALVDRFLGHVPFIGGMDGDRLLTRKVALSDVTGTYQRIKDGKEVFVITGKALNTAPVAMHGVEIAGKLFGRSGRVLEEKTIYCGNVISAKVLKDLTPREVSILQKLNPPKRFMIEPGESSTFVIVFMDPPRDAVEFSAQVAAAQRQA